MAIDNFCNNGFIGVSRSIGCGCPGYPCPQMPQAYNSVGPTGPQGPTGAQGPQGFQGPRGPQGLQGPQGLRGFAGAAGQTGAQGMAATVRVEAATSVPFDDAPNVVNVGTPQDAILRFTIPAGKPGADGEQGPKGDTGSTGPTGPKGDKGSTGPTGPKGTATYGQLTSIIANAELTKNVQVQVPLQYGGESNNVVLAQNTITIKEDGYYALVYAMHPFLILTEDYADLIFSLRKNGTDIPQTRHTVRSTRGTHNLDFYGNTIVKLSVNDVVDSAFKCNEDAKFFFSVDNISSLFLYKVS